jgi:hypothetical protein
MFDDINKNGYRDYRFGQPGLPYQYPEPFTECGGYTDSAGKHINRDTVFGDYDGDGSLDLIEPLLGSAALMSDSVYEDSLKNYLANHHQMNFDYDATPKNGVADPKTAIAITRTVQTIGGKAINNIMYGQSDAWRIEVTLWAESQGVRTSSPAKFVLPFIGK